LSTDWYSRLVLTVIAASLVVLAVQGGRAGGAGAGSDAEGRYRLSIVPMARMVVRFDTTTGTAWGAMFPDLKIWTKVAETPADLLDSAPAAPPKEPARKAPETEAGQEPEVPSAP